MLFLLTASFRNPSFGQNGEEVKVEINYDVSGGDVPVNYGHHTRFEEILSSPAIQRGIELGGDAINHSVENVMDALFYSLLDQRFSIDLNDATQVSLGLHRKLYESATGDYVVVDRIRLGPEYQKQIGIIGQVPVFFGVNTDFEMLDIYFRSDAIRLQEDQESSFWRRSLNNWFGLLPLLTLAMPPSFNPNEMHDPTRVLEMPFHFPGTQESLQRMKIGSVRTYGIAGGINLSFALARLINPSWIESLKKNLALGTALPYTLFVEGHHRINIMKRDEKVVWVGLSNMKKGGYSFAALVGNTLFLLTKVVPGFNWKGVPMPLFPIELELTQDVFRNFSLLYEFDTSKEGVFDAYQQSLLGDFAQAHEMSQQAESGVTYHFTRVEVTNETISGRSNNVFVVRQGSKQRRQEAEVEIDDGDQKHYSLVGSKSVKSEQWNAMVESETIETAATVDMAVDKIFADGSSRSSYEYKMKVTRSPINLRLSLQLIDRFTDVIEYRSYMRRLIRFLGMSLKELPDFPIIDQDLAEIRRREIFLANPKIESVLLKQTPLVLGRFSAVANVNIDSQLLQKVLDMPETEKSAILRQTFRDNQSFKSSGIGEEPNLLDWIKRAFVYPFRLVDLQWIDFDWARESRVILMGLRDIKRELSPLEKLESFYELFATDYPEILAEFFIRLLNDDLPRKVQFYTRPERNLRAPNREAFLSLNGKTILSDKTFPPPDPYSSVEEKISLFFPTNLQEWRKRPLIKRIQIFTKGTPNDSSQERVLVARIKSQFRGKVEQIHLFLRVEQAGRVKLGKLFLAEHLVTIKSFLPLDSNVPDEVEFEIPLNGSQSILQSAVVNRALSSGGDFLISMSTSDSGDLWSETRVLEIHMKDGYLFGGEN